MAVNLTTGTRRILDSLLIQADRGVHRALTDAHDSLPNVHPRAQVSGRLVTDLAAANTCVVTNGHLWPVGGTVVLHDGPHTERRTIARVESVDGRGRVGMPDSRGHAPAARLTFTTASAATYHAVDTDIWLDAGDVPFPATALDSGLVGVHDVAAFVRSLMSDAGLSCGGVPGLELVATGGSATQVDNTGVNPGTFGNNCMVGATVTFEPDTTTANLRNTTAVISATPSADRFTFPTAGTPGALADAAQAGDTYRVSFPVIDDVLAELDAYLPAGATNTGARGTSDTSLTPGVLGTTVLNALAFIIDQFNGAMPAETVNGATFGALAHDVPVRSTLTAPAATGATTLAVEDASLFQVGDTVVTVNALSGATTNTDTVVAVNARRGGQGPNTLTVTALAADADIPTLVVVAAAGVDRGRRKRAPLFPHAGRTVAEWLRLAVTQVATQHTTLVP